MRHRIPDLCNLRRPRSFPMDLAASLELLSDCLIARNPGVLDISCRAIYHGTPGHHLRTEIVNRSASLQVRADVGVALFLAGDATLFIVSAFGILMASPLVHGQAPGSTTVRSVATVQLNAEAAEAISHPVLSQDEVGQFAAAVDAMDSDPNAEIATEQSSSANLARELRTLSRDW